jgi:hypothetical protein
MIMNRMESLLVRLDGQPDKNLACIQTTKQATTNRHANTKKSKRFLAGRPENVHA